MSKKIYLIDGNSFIYRMFFALPEFSRSDGRVVNATFGMAKFFVGQLVKEKPDYLVFIKDAKGKNFRHEIYEQYKATREKMPDTLRTQIKDIEDLIKSMNIDIIEISGYEADDVIGTLSVRLSQESDNEIYILSGDKDLYALVDEQVKVYDTQRKKISGPEETFEKFGVPARCVRDYLAICGDSSDNIPGIAGIGPKKATVLLNEFSNLESIYEIIENIDEKYITISSDSQKILKGKTLEKFIVGKDLAFLSQKLATLDCDVDLEGFQLEDYSFSPKEIYTDELNTFFEEFEFHSLMGNNEKKKDSWDSLDKKVSIIGDTLGLDELYENITNSETQEIILDTETTSLNPREADVVGVSIMLGEEIYYINHLHRGPNIDRVDLQKFIQKLLSTDILIVGHNLKYDLQVLQIFVENNNGKNSVCNGDSTDGQMTLEL